MTNDAAFRYRQRMLQRQILGWAIAHFAAAILVAFVIFGVTR